jgi:hypothetical protein
MFLKYHKLVLPTIVSKCFKLSGFPISSEVNSDSDVDDDIPLIQLAKINTIAQVDHETLVAFDQHVPIEDHTDKWEKNLIESHLLCFIPLLEQRALYNEALRLY